MDQATPDASMPLTAAQASAPSDAPAPKARRTAHPANRRSADDWVTALQDSRASFLATTAVPEDPAEAMRGGLLLTPLLGCKARTPLDWTHAWAMLGEGLEPLHSPHRHVSHRCTHLAPCLRNAQCRPIIGTDHQSSHETVALLFSSH